MWVGELNDWKRSPTETRTLHGVTKTASRSSIVYKPGRGAGLVTCMVQQSLLTVSIRSNLRKYKLDVLFSEVELSNVSEMLRLGPRLPSMLQCALN